MNLYNIEISTKPHRTVPTLPQLEIINLWNSLQLISGFYIVISFHLMRKSTCVHFTHFIFSNTIPAVRVDGCMYLRVRSLCMKWLKCDVIWNSYFYRIKNCMNQRIMLFLLVFCLFYSPPDLRTSRTTTIKWEQQTNTHPTIRKQLPTVSTLSARHWPQQID